MLQIIKRQIIIPIEVTISKLIESCREEQDIDKKVEILYRINSMLPKVHRLKIPSLLGSLIVITDQINVGFKTAVDKQTIDGALLISSEVLWTLKITAS